MAEEWKTAKAGDVITLEAGDNITGKFMSMERSKKFPDSYAIKIETETGQKVIFANEMLKQKIEDNNIMKNQEVMILFKGMVKNQAGSREYKDFELMYK